MKRLCPVQVNIGESERGVRACSFLRFSHVDEFFSGSLMRRRSLRSWPGISIWQSTWTTLRWNIFCIVMQSIMNGARLPNQMHSFNISKGSLAKRTAPLSMAAAPRPLRMGAELYTMIWARLDVREGLVNKHEITAGPWWFMTRTIKQKYDWLRHVLTDDDNISFFNSWDDSVHL